ncbi:UNVERIFIED_CONTAM: Retrovirus-related Pol polyprotein from transposon opus [Sesamum calycinum]|uniref:Retrovirus-related Pol polyprotein from transposon opus n=1 Tax=Sesamum calycinum TaxID=2727403 RepID=A0AAW2QZC2_9LAMI
MPPKSTQATVDYLGHVISAAGVAADPAKLQAIADLPSPRSFTELRAFLGLTSSSGPPTAAAAFTALKTAMLCLPVLTLPDFTLPFDVTTDASQIAIGAVLSIIDGPSPSLAKR